MAFPPLPPLDPLTERQVPRVWRGAFLALLLLPGVALAADWRTDPPLPAISASVEARAQQTGDSGLAERWRRALESASAASRLGDALCEALLGIDPRLDSLLAGPPGSPPEWLESVGELGPSLKLAIAERLAAEERYDDALRWTEGLDPESTYSPALVCYLRLVALRMMVDDKAAAKELERLGEFLPDDARDSLGPARGWLVDTLRRELKEKPEPLPTVARKMGDVERRLALREVGKPTLDVQQEILDELDKLIKNLEEQRKQQQAAAAAGGGGAAPSQAAEESRPSDFKGPGEVDRKRLIAGDGWGALPPAERERLTQAITRDLPPHYRTLVEDYFRTLAEQDDAPPAEESGPEP